MSFLTRLNRLLPALLLTLVGLTVAYTGARYRTGTLTAMGPGFMPVLLGLVLAGLGALLLMLVRRHPDSPDDAGTPMPLRPVLCAGGGIIVWALLVDIIGFFPAGMAQLLLSAFALPQQNWRRVLAGGAAFCLALYALFVLMLGLPIPAFGF